MAHELDINIAADGTEVASFADSRTDAWHGLGQKVNHCMTAAEVLEEGKLGGWNVRKHPLTTIDDDGNTIAVDDRWATVRTNPVTGGTDYLGVVGKIWTPVQNEDTTSFLNALVDESGAHFETAGALRGGREVFVTLRLPNYLEFDLPGGGTDSTDLYIAALNSHDGSSSFKTIVTPVRIVCANTQGAALADARSMWSARHSLNVLEAVEGAREALKISFTFADAFGQEVAKMIDTQVDQDEARRLIGQVFDVEGSDTQRQRDSRLRQVDNVLDGLTLPTCDGIRGTRYGLYNAVTEYIDHRIEVKGGLGVPAEKQIFGAYADTKSRAFSLLAV